MDKTETNNLGSRKYKSIQAVIEEAWEIKYSINFKKIYNNRIFQESQIKLIIYYF